MTMVESSYQITYVTRYSQSFPMLASQEQMDALLDYGVTSSVDEYSAIGAAWGIALPKGGRRSELEWSRYRDHASHAAAASYCQSYPMTLPYLQTGELRIQYPGQALVVHRDAVILSCTCTPVMTGSFRTLTRYRVGVGK